MNSKLILFVVLLTITREFNFVQSLPSQIGRFEASAFSETNNYLEEQAFLKSQYEKVIPIYYKDRTGSGYDYPKPEIPFESEKQNSGGYIYNRPDIPFNYPPKPTTESLVPPASARTII